MSAAEQIKKPKLTKEVINEARQEYGIAVTLLLSSSGAGSSGNKAFYANFVMRMNVEFTDMLPGNQPLETAAVFFTSDKLNMSINPQYFLSLNTMSKVELLIHEIEHITNLHMLRFKELGLSDKKDMTLFNLATDSNINRHLQTAEENGWITHDRLNKLFEKEGSATRLDPSDASEVHFWKLKELQNPPEDGGTDDHSQWSEGEVNEELAKAIVRDAMNKAVEATGVSNCPNHILQQLGSLNKSLVNWKRELQQFAVRTMKFNREKTRSRRNRRFGILQQGSRKEPKVKLVICLDSSGSVSNESFTQFFSEVDKIASMGIKITVIDADTGVAAVYDYEKGKTPIQRMGNGGTSYGPAIEHAKTLEPDGIIYMGDMDSSDSPSDPKLPFLWAVVGTQTPPATFGRTVYITDKR